MNLFDNFECLIHDLKKGVAGYKLLRELPQSIFLIFIYCYIERNLKLLHHETRKSFLFEIFIGCGKSFNSFELLIYLILKKEHLLYVGYYFLIFLNRTILTASSLSCFYYSIFALFSTLYIQPKEPYPIFDITFQWPIDLGIS